MALLEYTLEHTVTMASIISKLLLFRTVMLSSHILCTQPWVIFTMKSTRSVILLGFYLLCLCLWQINCLKIVEHADRFLIELKYTGSSFPFFPVIANCYFFILMWKIRSKGVVWTQEGLCYCISSKTADNMFWAVADSNVLGTVAIWSSLPLLPLREQLNCWPIIL